MFGIGTVVASIPAGAAIDVAGNSNLASTSGDNTVTYDNIGTLEFGLPVFDATEGGVATITVNRRGGSDGPVSIHYSTVALGFANLADYTPPTTDILEWTNGDDEPKEFTVSITADGANEGRERFGLLLSNPGGTVHLGDIDAEFRSPRTIPRSACSLTRTATKVTLN